MNPSPMPHPQVFLGPQHVSPGANVPECTRMYPNVPECTLQMLLNVPSLTPFSTTCARGFGSKMCPCSSCACLIPALSCFVRSDASSCPFPLRSFRCFVLGRHKLIHICRALPRSKISPPKISAMNYSEHCSVLGIIQLRIFPLTGFLQ